jgi:hypothetical protein
MRRIFDLSLNVPMSRYIGDALGAVFAARPSAKSLTDPWGAMISKRRV